MYDAGQALENASVMVRRLRSQCKHIQENVSFLMRTVKLTASNCFGWFIDGSSIEKQATGNCNEPCPPNEQTQLLKMQTVLRTHLLNRAITTQPMVYSEQPCSQVLLQPGVWRPGNQATSCIRRPLHSLLPFLSLLSPFLSPPLSIPPTFFLSMLTSSCDVRVMVVGTVGGVCDIELRVAKPIISKCANCRTVKVFAM